MHQFKLIKTIYSYEDVSKELLDCYINNVSHFITTDTRCIFFSSKETLRFARYPIYIYEISYDTEHGV